MFKKSLIIFTILMILISNINYADDKSTETMSSVELRQTIEASNNMSEVPKINSRHAVVIERNTHAILYGKKETEKCKMASTTKIMTATIVIENANLNDVVTVSAKAARTGGSRLGLSTNDKITVENLLYGLMLCSGNDAAVALAEHVGGDLEGFANLMNKKASSLGLSSTHFVTPHGLDNDSHYTTAYDLAVLTDYALQNKTFAKIVRTKYHTITLNNHSKALSNTNELLGNLDGVYGVKTGFTNGANRCLVTSCKRGDLDIVCVVLGCDTKKDRTRDNSGLINYTFQNYTIVNLKDTILSDFEKWSNEHKNSFTINKGSSHSLELYLDNNDIPYETIAIKKSDMDKIYTSITFNSYYEAPLASNSIIGSLSIFVNDRLYFKTDILNYNEIPKKDILDYFSNLISNYSSYL